MNLSDYPRCASCAFAAIERRIGWLRCFNRAISNNVVRPDHGCIGHSDLSPGERSFAPPEVVEFPNPLPTEKI